MSQSVQLRVKSSLLTDYATISPFQLDAPASSTAATANYPRFALVPDGSGRPGIFYDTAHNANNPYRLYTTRWEKHTASWRQEATPPTNLIGNPTNYSSFGPLKAKLNPVTGKVSVATAIFLGSTQTAIAFLSGDSWYPSWTILNAPASANRVALDLTFDSFGAPAVYVWGIKYSNQPTSSWDTIWKWSPLTPNSVPVLAFSSPLPALDTIFSLAYGHYQDRAVDPTLSPLEGFYVTDTVGLPGKTTGLNCKRATPVPAGHKPALSTSPVTSSYYSAFNNVDTFYLDDASSAPLLVGANDSGGVVWIANNQYAIPASNSNTTRLFPDVPLKANWATVLATGSNAQEMKIHVLATFVDTDGSMQLWCTTSRPNSITETTGIYDVLPNGWGESVLITSDILSGKQFGFTWTYTNQPTHHGVVIDGIPMVVVVNANRSMVLYTLGLETESWTAETIESSMPDAANATTITKQVHYTEAVTVLSGDGTPVTDIPVQVGSDSALNLQINGRDFFVDSAHTANVNVDSAGRVAITQDANDQLLAPSFWIRTGDMADGERVDIQPGAAKLHEKLLDIKSQGLENTKLDDGTLLVPSNQNNDKVMQDVQDSLLAMIPLLSSDNSTDPQGETDYVYKSTSRNLARTRSHKTQPRHRLGRVNPVPGMAIRITFKDGFRFEHLTQEQLQHHKMQFGSGGLFGYDSIGELWDDVRTSVVEIVDVVLETVNDGVDFVKAQFTILKDKIEQGFEAAVDWISEVVEFVGMAFKAVAVELGRLVEWLSFLFSWDDILATKDYFKAAVNRHLTAFAPAAQTVVQYLQSNNGQAMTNAKAQLAADFSSTSSALNDMSFASIEQQYPQLTKNKAAAPGSPATADVGSVSDSLDAGATWILDKFAAVFGDSSLPFTGDATDESLMRSEFESLRESIIGDESSQQFDDAMNQFSSIFGKVTSQDDVGKLTFSDLLAALKGFGELAMDLFQNAVGVLVRIAQFMINTFQKMFNTTVQSQLIIKIYHAIAGEGDDPTYGDIFCLLLATPFTVIYKLVTGENLVPTETFALSSTLPSDKQEEARWYKVMGTLTIVETIIGAIFDVLAITTRAARGDAIANAIVAGNDNLSSQQEFNQLFSPTRQIGESTGFFNDSSITVGEWFATAFAAISTISVLPQGIGYFKERTAEVEPWVNGIRGGCGLANFIIAVIAYTNTSPSTVQSKLAVAADSAGAARDILYIIEIFVKVPVARIVFLISRAVFGVAQSALYFAIAKELQSESSSSSSTLKPRSVLSNNINKKDSPEKKSATNGYPDSSFTPVNISGSTISSTDNNKKKG